MVNTNNKFTLNKKGFALSLACAGLLATAGNAAITSSGILDQEGQSSANLFDATNTGTIIVDGSNQTLGVNRGADIELGAITIKAGSSTNSKLGAFKLG